MKDIIMGFNSKEKKINKSNFFFGIIEPNNYEKHKTKIVWNIKNNTGTNKKRKKLLEKT